MKNDGLFHITGKMSDAVAIFNRFVRGGYVGFDSDVWNADMEWKYSHTMRVFSLASKILGESVPVFSGTEGEEILLGAALFHDIGRFEQFSSRDRSNEYIEKTKGGHGHAGATILETEVRPLYPKLFSDEQWDMIIALVKRHDTNFLSTETISRTGRKPVCDRNAFLLFASILRDADIVDNCFNLYGPSWWERIRNNGFRGFDIEKTHISDSLFEAFEKSFNGKDETDNLRLLAETFNSYRAKTLGDAMLCLLSSSARLSFEISKKMVIESDLHSRVSETLNTDEKTRRAYLFLKKSLGFKDIPDI